MEVRRYLNIHLETRKHKINKRPLRNEENDLNVKYIKHLLKSENSNRNKTINYENIVHRFVFWRRPDLNY